MTAVLAALLLALACLAPAPVPDRSDVLIAASEHQAGNRVQWPAQEAAR